MFEFSTKDKTIGNRTNRSRSDPMDRWICHEWIIFSRSGITDHDTHATEMHADGGHDAHAEAAHDDAHAESRKCTTLKRRMLTMVMTHALMLKKHMEADMLTMHMRSMQHIKLQTVHGLLCM